jgi:Aldo/keto reductase family
LRLGVDTSHARPTVGCSTVDHTTIGAIPRPPPDIRSTATQASWPSTPFVRALNFLSVIARLNFLFAIRREESFVIAQTLREHAAKMGRTLLQFALAWLWANPIVSSVIVGPRTIEQWDEYVGALGTKWTDEDEKLVDSMVAPGHPSTPGYNDPQYPFFGRVRE